MKYLRIEKALTHLVGDPEQAGRFYQTAGIFENILKDDSLNADEKAAKIAEVIEAGIQDY